MTTIFPAVGSRLISRPTWQDYRIGPPPDKG